MKELQNLLWNASAQPCILQSCQNGTKSGDGFDKAFKMGPRTKTDLTERSRVLLCSCFLRSCESCGSFVTVVIRALSSHSQFFTFLHLVRISPTCKDRKNSYPRRLVRWEMRTEITCETYSMTFETEYTPVEYSWGRFATTMRPERY